MPIRGKRSHSGYAHLYGEVLRLRSKAKTWDEIAEALTKSEGQQVPRTSLYSMWKKRQSGAVKVEPKEVAVVPVKAKREAAATKHGSALEDEWKPRTAFTYGPTKDSEKSRNATERKKEPSPWDKVSTDGLLQ